MNISPAELRAAIGGLRKAREPQQPVKPVFVAPASALYVECWNCRDRGQHALREPWHQCADTCSDELAGGGRCLRLRAEYVSPDGVSVRLPCFGAARHRKGKQ